MPSPSALARVGLGLFLALSLPTSLSASINNGVVMNDSVLPVDKTPLGGGKGSRAFVSRANLTAQESSASLTIELPLRMRNFAELETRVAKGEQITAEEMAQKYEPTVQDFQRVVAWAKAQGLTITRQDDHRLAVFARAPVGQLAGVFGVNFARVQAHGKEFTSAITAPSLPVGLTSVLLGVNGLQPHLRAHKHLKSPSAQPNYGGGGATYYPDQIAAAYDITSLHGSNIDGSGQSIAIVIDTFPATSDLVEFWSKSGVNQSIGNIQFIQAVAGELAEPSGEETLDTEWSSAIAPGANVRVYAATDLESADLDTAYQQVLDDATNHPEYHLHQMTMSYGSYETDSPNAQLDTDHQLYVSLTAAGVTCFASSGDGGSTPDDNGGERGPLEPENPASDPNVTGVGGTSLVLNSNNTVESESVWNDGENGGASGGGTSVHFSRPSWQTGTGVNLSSNRQVPDIAATADPDYGGFVYLNGRDTVYGGTSLASPICAAECALLNQVRANAGLPAIGFLNPNLYSLIGSSSFRDIVDGNNFTPLSLTKYAAEVGFDQCTGVGVPLASNFVRSLGSSSPIGVENPAALQFVTPGSTGTFSVSVGGAAATYQWQRLPAGSTSWSNLSDGGSYSGSTSGTLTVSSTTTSMNGDEFRCAVTLPSTTITTSPATLEVETFLPVNVVAGSTSAGLVNGYLTQARFNTPSGVALDSGGDLFIADYANNQIRKISPTGTVTSPFGSASGASGSQNGTGNSATFDTPNSVALDASNNLYVADSGNNEIRKIVGSSVSTFVTSSAGLSNPQGVAVDPNSGNIYVADTGNNVIRKVTPAGVVSILAGVSGSGGYQDGSVGQALFNQPLAVTVDGSGNVWVADYGNAAIRKISNGTVATIAGGEAMGYRDGQGSTALFDAPTGLSFDSAGNLWITDAQVPPVGSNLSGNGVLRKMTPAGVVTTLAGAAGQYGTTTGTGTTVTFYSPQSVVCSNNGAYLADAYNNRIDAIGTPLGAAQIVAKTPATITLGNLSATYNGSPQPVSVTTNPSGLNVIVSYSSSTLSSTTTPPTNAGTYTVEATINDPTYGGSTAGTLVIAGAAATVTLGNLTVTYDGAAQQVTVATTPPNLTYTVTYNNSTTPPGAPGSYTVVAQVTDPNSTGYASGTFVIQKAPATVTLGNLSAGYTGHSIVATATTNPSGLPVTFTYNGSAVAPVAVGSYTVLGSASSADYAGSATGTLVISPGSATVTVANQSVPYTGSPISASATTVPAGLSLGFTYNGSSAAPTSTGTYTVIGTVTNPNYTGSGSGTLTITPPLAKVTLSGLTATYNGSPHAVTVTTAPANVPVTLTYNGSSTAPTTSGTYTVAAAVDSPNYSGSATGTLVIAKAAGTVTLGNLAAAYSGSPIAATATTVPSGLSVNFTYNGSSTVPTSTGTYTVIGTINDPDYQGTKSGLLVISKATATVQLGNLATTYNATPQSASATTSPSGLTVNFTYNGSATAPTNAGSYAVIGKINEANYTGSATGTLVISKTTATIALGNLAATYTGHAIAATATTTPTGQAVTFAYAQNGKAAVPENAGSYSVTATVNTANSAGSATGTLVISPAAATVTIPTKTAAYTGLPITDLATTIPAKLPVSYTYDSSAIAPTLTGTYTVTGTQTNPNYMGSGTGTLTIAPVLALPVTGVATALTSASATLSGTVNPRGSLTTVTFQYGATTTYGATASAGTAFNGTAATAVTAAISGLPTGTLYHYRVVAANGAGTANGLDRTFLTRGPGSPNPAQAYLAASGAQLSLSINPNGVATTVYVEYGTSSGDYTRQSTSQSIGAGTLPVNVSTFLSGLTVNTTYYYRFVMTSSAGTFTTSEQSFLTLSFETSEVAATGEAAPGTTSTWTSLGNAAVNSTDGVAFTAKTVSGPTGVWANPPSTESLTLVAVTGTAAPGTSGSFVTLSDPVYDDNADVAFEGTAAGSTGVWESEDGTLSLVARTGTSAPGTSGANFATLTALGLTPNAGAIVAGTIAGTGITTADNAGVWEGTTLNNLTLYLRTGEMTDTGKTIAAITFLPTTEIVVNGQTRGFGPTTGHLAAHATFSDHTTGIVKVATAASPIAVATTGTLAPGTSGAEFATFGSPAINDGAHVAFYATLTTGVGGVTAANDAGVWADPGTGTLQLVARSGSACPGLTGTFTAFSDPIDNVNDAVAFRSTISGPGVTTLNNSGIWCSSTGALALVARTGTQAPGCLNGINFGAFTELALDNAGGSTQKGGVIFASTLTGTGVTAANNAGIFAVDATGALQLIVRTGEILNGKTISALSFLPTEIFVNGQARSFSQASGDLVYNATFTDGSHAIFNVQF